MKILKALLHLCILMALSGCYSLKVAYEFSGLYLSKTPTSEILDSGKTDNLTVEFFKSVSDVRDFLQRNGLDPGGAYTSYIDLNRSSVSYGVTAAERYDLQQKKWFYLFVGDAPYRGFFNEAERDQFMAELSKNYDVYGFEVAAFSGLGYFDELLTSSMKKWPRWYLVKTIIHEVIHRNYWIRGSARLNELVAEYFAVMLSRKYFEERKFQNDLDSMEHSLNRRKSQIALVKETKKELKKLYSQKGDRLRIERDKKKIYQELNNKLYGAGSLKSELWNNARLLLAGMYQPDEDRFKKIQACVKSDKMVDYFEYLKQHKPRSVIKFLTDDKDLSWNCRRGIN
jgi:predicted aminopeptidase